MLEEYKVGSHILLKKNPNFWNADNVNLAGVRILFISDATTSLQAMRPVKSTSPPSCPARRFPACWPRIPTSPASRPGNSYFQFNMDADVVNDLQCAQGPALAH